MSHDESQTVGHLACEAGSELRGAEQLIGPARIYVCSPDQVGCPEEEKRKDCIVIAHDFDAFDNTRLRRLVDCFASQGWLAVLPDFSPQSADVRGEWFESLRQYCVDYLLPWLEEEQGIEAWQCFAIGGGVIPCGYAAKANAEHLAYGAKAPLNLGSVLVHPVLRKPHILNEGEFQKTIALLPNPVLVMPARNDPPEVVEGGLLEAQLRILQREVEFLSFEQVSRGFLLEPVDPECEEIRTATSWAMDAASEFFHRQFARADRSSLAPPVVEEAPPPGSDGEDSPASLSPASAGRG